MPRIDRRGPKRRREERREMSISDRVGGRGGEIFATLLQLDLRRTKRILPLTKIDERPVTRRGRRRDWCPQDLIPFRLAKIFSGSNSTGSISMIECLPKELLVDPVAETLVERLSVDGRDEVATVAVGHPEPFVDRLDRRVRVGTRHQTGRGIVTDADAAFPELVGEVVRAVDRRSALLGGIGLR